MYIIYIYIHAIVQTINFLVFLLNFRRCKGYTPQNEPKRPSKIGLLSPPKGKANVFQLLFRGELLVLGRILFETSTVTHLCLISYLLFGTKISFL